MAFTLSYVSYYGEVPIAHLVDTVASADIPSLTHSDYEFVGWYYDTQYNQAVVIGDTLSDNTTIYAKWNSGNKYFARMNGHTLLEQVGSTTASIKYNNIDIPSPVQDRDVTLLTNGKIVPHQITLDNQNIGVIGKVYTGDVVLSAVKFISPPIIGIVGDNIYVLDTTNDESDTINVSSDNITIGTLYRVNQMLENVTSSTAEAFLPTANTLRIVYVPTAGYTLPSAITVTNARYEWDNISGVLILSNPTGIVTVTIRGVVE